MLIQRLRAFIARKFVRDTITLQIGKIGVLAFSLIGAIVVPRLMQPVAYGRLQLILSLYTLWQVFNLTGVIPSAHTRLAEAVGARDAAELTGLMGFFLRLTLIYAVLSTGVLWLVGQFTPAAVILYDGNREIILLTAVLTLTQPSEHLFKLFTITHSSRRRMQAVVKLQILNQFMLTATTIVAVIISQTALSVVLSRLIYSYTTLIIAAAHYRHTRLDGKVAYPALSEIVSAIRVRRSRQDLQFGFSNALDKNLGTVFTVLPVQITGVLLGEAAAGYVGLALSITQQQNFFTAAILDNLRAVIPQAVGKGDYVRLWRNFKQILTLLLGAVVVFYGVYAWLSPLFVPVLFGEDWLPVIPLLQIMAIFGAITTIGGVFGPLYRVFDFLRGALMIKIATLLINVPVGVYLIVNFDVVGGAWMIVLMFAISVPLTIWITLPELRHRARLATIQTHQEP